MRKAIALFAVLMLIGCSSRQLTKSYSEAEVRAFRQIAVLEPISSLVEIGKKERREIFTETKRVSSQFHDEIETSLRLSDSRYFRLSELGITKDTVVHYLDLAFSADSVPRLRNDTTLGLGESKKLLITYFAGWYKDDALRRWENTKTILWAIFSLGQYYVVYYPAGVNFYSVLIDLENGRVVYRDRRLVYVDLRDPKTVMNLTRKSISSYFK